MTHKAWYAIKQRKKKPTHGLTIVHRPAKTNIHQLCADDVPRLEDIKKR